MITALQAQELDERLATLQVSRLNALAYQQDGSDCVSPEEIAEFSGRILELERTIKLLKGELC